MPHSLSKEGILGCEFLGQYEGRYTKDAVCQQLPRAMTLTRDRSLFDKARKKHTLVSVVEAAAR